MIIIEEKEINICIINIYFGKLPNYFSLWLKSASKNANIDFYLYTDRNIDLPVPKNVLIKKCSLEFIKRRATQELGFETTLNNSYKCCDYKSIYGLIFKDDLKKYDYWGHCDLDLIWGDLEKTFIVNKLTNYDRFFFLGHLSLYKNNDDVNHYFMQDGSRDNYKTVYTNDRNFIFDEIPGTVSIYEKHGYSMFKRKLFADISPIYSQYRLSNLRIDNTTIKNYKKQLFYWDNGKVFRAFVTHKSIEVEEFAYIHFQKRKNFNVGFNVNSVCSFFITPKGFFEKKNNNITMKDFDIYNKWPGEIIMIVQFLFYKVKKKIRSTKDKFNGKN